MIVNVLLFGISKEMVGKQKMTFEVQELTSVADFKQALQKEYPKLIELNSMAIAVNSEYALDNDKLQPNDEVALIPPVSGG